MIRTPLRIAHVTTIDLSLKFLLLDQLKALKASGFEVTGISAPGPWVGHLEAAGIRHIPWTQASRSWGVRADGRALIELARILRRERFDLVHTHNTKPGIVGRIVARSSGVPAVVNTVHGLYASPADRLRKKLPVLALERVAAVASDLELYQSEEDLRWARRIGLLGGTRSVYLGNGIDLERFDPAAVSPERKAAVRAELEIPEDALVVGTVARMVAKKGLHEFFAVARSVRSTRPEVRFIVVGGLDPEKGDAIAPAEIERARSDVTITGWREDARDLIAIMDIFVLASWWGEGKPRSAMEAAALGKPLVLTDVRGCREVARHGIEGLLSPPRDAAALAANVERLLDDPDVRKSLGTAARARAAIDFDQRAVFSVVVNEYGELLARKGLARWPQTMPCIRPARREDSHALAQLHAQALPDAFMTRLGTRFLGRLYRAMADAEDSVCLVVATDGNVVGFASAVVSMPAFSRRFALRHGLAATLAIGPRLGHPRMVRGLFEDVRYARRQPELAGAELVSIAIAPTFRNQGLARSLIEGIVARLGELGVPEVKVLAGAGNDEANVLYGSLGFKPQSTTTLHRGVRSHTWRARCHS